MKYFWSKIKPYRLLFTRLGYVFLVTIIFLETEVSLPHHSQQVYAITESEEPYLNSQQSLANVWSFPTVEGGYISNPYSSSHLAIDIAGCPYRSAIYAANNGIVITTARKWDNGLYIVIKHDLGYYTMYAHLASITVTEGQRVATKQVIGEMGNSGNATGVHLDFSVWEGYPHASRAIPPEQILIQ